MGITKDGIADALSQSITDVEFYDIGTTEPYAIRGEEIKQRKGLVQIIKQKEKELDYATAYSSVIEEVAYTWFNRLIAVRFMEVNDYMPSHVRVLSSETGKLEPDLVTTPFDAELDLSDAEKQQIIHLKNDNKLDETFRLLFIKQCNALHVVLPRLFENISDYSELLLNVSFVDQDGVVYHLVHDIDEDDFNIEKGGQVEILGWLYQYYNAELKDETFALLKNNVKVTKERIPSATQLFTPDWIVRYMVENSLGRLWVEGHPNDALKSGWKYYLDEAEQEDEVKAQLEEIRKEYAKLTPEDIKVIDPCMGSGHILVYAFDVLMQIYESAGYTQRDAARYILENNLFGLDIDERAAQLAYFAVLMKARQYNRRILNDYVMCNVYAIRESNGIGKSVLESLGDTKVIGEKLVDAFVDAKEYGSILNIDIRLDELEALEQNIEALSNKTSYENMFDAINSEAIFNQIVPLMLQAKLLVQKYDAVVTNPPYRAISDCTDKLNLYAKTFYEDSKSDLATICMEKTLELCKMNGFMAMINIPAWMFIVTYQGLRQKLLTNNSVINMLHLGRGIFGSDFGTTAFVFKKNKLHLYKGTYLKLYEKQGAVDDVDTKEKWFFEKKNLHVINQEAFFDIPGTTLAYWVSKNFISKFSCPKIGNIAEPKVGLQTGDNNKFIRLWHEVNHERMGTVDGVNRKWIPYNKGGDFRKWYGNFDYVVNWEDDGYEIKNFTDSKGKLRSRPQNVDYYFRPSITWSFISASYFGVRYSPHKAIFDVAGSSVFPEHDDAKYICGLLCSKLSTDFMIAQNPTLNFQVGNVANIPVIISNKEKVSSLTDACIGLSKEDWDSFETSWEFKRHPLI